MYFKLLPNLQFSQQILPYRFTEQDYIITKNIFRTIDTQNSAYSTDLFAEFFIKDGVRPDQIADNLYGDPTYDWIILLTNKIKNYYQDWPLSQVDFENYMTNKYGINFEGVHHYETVEIRDDLGQIVQPAGIIRYYDPTEVSIFTITLRNGLTVLPALSVKTRGLNYPVSNTFYTRTGQYTIGNPSDSNYKLTYTKSYNPLVIETIFGDQGLVPVSNYEYETKINEKKRTIQLLKPAYLQTFLNLFKAATGYIPTSNLVDAKTKSTSK